MYCTRGFHLKHILNSSYRSSACFQQQCEAETTRFLSCMLQCNPNPKLGGTPATVDPFLLCYPQITLKPSGGIKKKKKKKKEGNHGILMLRRDQEAKEVILLRVFAYIAQDIMQLVEVETENFLKIESNPFKLHV